MTLSYRNAVAVGTIVFYVPACAVGIYLLVLHGWRKSHGWLLLATFSLARIIGCSLQLATIDNPRDVSLYIASAVIDNLGLAPLMLASLGLLGRVRHSIHKTRQTMVTTTVLSLDDLVILLAVVLSIVGSTSIPHSAFQNPDEPLEIPNTLTAGSSLYIVAYVLLALMTACLCLHIRHAEHGEKRLLAAVALSLPFLLVRLVYTCLSVLGQVAKFGFAHRDTTIFLCMTLIMEAVVVIIYEVAGLTLRRLSADDREQIKAERESGNRRGQEESGNKRARGESYRLTSSQGRTRGRGLGSRV